MIKHKTIVIEVEIDTDYTKRAEIIDEKINKFIEKETKELKSKNYNHLKIFEKDVKNYYYEKDGIGYRIYLISFFYTYS